MTLAIGQTVRVFGKTWRVGMVNASRARLDPLNAAPRAFTDRFGQTHQFDSYGASVSVSPEAQVEIVEP